MRLVHKVDPFPGLGVEEEPLSGAGDHTARSFGDTGPPVLWGRLSEFN